MKTEELLHTTGETLEYAKQYAQQQIDYLRLDAAERLAKTTSSLITSLVVAFFCAMVLGFLSLTIGLYFGALWGSYALSFFCITLFYVIVTTLTYYFRHQLITNPLLSSIIKSMFD